MPWDNWNSNNDLRNCYNNRPRNSYYDSRDRYWGPLEWWSVFANLLLSWTTDLMEEPDHLVRIALVPPLENSSSASLQQYQ